MDIRIHDLKTNADFFWTNGSSRLADRGFDPGCTCCFTGHRPNRLPDRGKDGGAELERLKAVTLGVIGELVDKGYHTFITGMAPGFDLMAARLLVEQYAADGRIDLVCAVPYYSQIDELKNEQDILLYERVLQTAKTVVVFFDEKTDRCYKVRNQFMVDHSSAVIAYCTSKSARSGTLQTLRMAEKAGLKIFRVGIDGVGAGDDHNNAEDNNTDKNTDKN